MSHTPHDLATEFPDLVDRLHALKQTDSHFHQLCETYATVNHAVYRAESNLEPTDDLHLEEMKKQRMHLKDQIYAALRHHP